MGFLLRGHLIVDHPERRHLAVRLTIGVVEGFGVEVHPVRCAVGAEKLGAPDVGLAFGDLPRPLPIHRTLLRDDGVDGPSADPLLGRCAEGVPDGIGNPADPAVVDTHDHVGDIGGQHAELFFGGRYPLGQFGAFGDVPPGQADEVLAGLRGTDVVVAQIIEKLIAIGEVVEDDGFTGGGAIAVIREQPGAPKVRQGLHQAVAEQFLAGQSQVVRGGPVDVPVDQVDDHSVPGADSLHQHLRIHQCVGIGLRHCAGLRQEGVVVERPDAAFESGIWRRFGHHPQVGW